MKITVSQNGEVTYMQVTDQSKRLHRVLERLTELQAGGDVSVIVENNGHKFPFTLAAFDVEPIIRDMNGIVSKTQVKAVAPTAQA